MVRATEDLPIKDARRIYGLSTAQGCCIDGSGGFGDGRAVWAGVRGRRVPLEDVPRSRDAFVEHAWVHRRMVGHDLDRNRSEPHRAGEERTRRGAVSASRDQDIDDLAVLIDRAVEAGCSVRRA